MDSEDHEEREGGETSQHLEPVVVMHAPCPSLTHADDVRDDHPHVCEGHEEVEENDEGSVGGFGVQEDEGHEQAKRHRDDGHREVGVGGDDAGRNEHADSWKP